VEWVKRSCVDVPPDPARSIERDRFGASSEKRMKRRVTPHNVCMRIRVLSGVFLVLALALTVQGTRQATPGNALPSLKRQATPKSVVDEHLDALNRCDWTRLMAQYPSDVEFFLPGGQVVKGRREVGELFEGFVKPFKDGGLCGLTFASEHVLVVGDTVNVQWRANADFLAAPYRGADAYVTQDGLMRAQVSTFDGSQLKKK
jgi:ketosteroid isomerase-like protein